MRCARHAKVPGGILAFLAPIGGGERMAMEQESVLLKTNHLRCPACFLIRDLTPKYFTCTLTRCPRVFLDVTPPGLPTPAGVRIEPHNPK